MGYDASHDSESEDGAVVRLSSDDCDDASDQTEPDEEEAESAVRVSYFSAWLFEVLAGEVFTSSRFILYEYK